MRKLLSFILATALLSLPFGVSALTIPTGRATSGDLSISGTTTDNATASNITVLSSAGISSTTVASVSGFAAGNYVMVYQMQGTGVGGYEFQKIRSITGLSLFFYGTLTNSYQATGAQVIKVSEYHNVTINSGGTWTAASWNGTTGGVLVAFLTGSVNLKAGGAITASSGFSGGSGCQGTGCGGVGGIAQQGTGSTGTGAQAQGSNTNGGGGANVACCSSIASGAGGGNGTAGSAGTGSSGGTGGVAGTTIGNAALTSAVLGGGGGGGACNYNVGCTSGSGASGSGIIILVSASSTMSGGAFSANGGTGGSGADGGGGGGSGGSIRLPVRLNLTLGTAIVTASGGAGGSGGSAGGSGGSGRIATVSAASVSGTASPTIDTSSTDTVYDLDIDATNVMLSSAF